MKQVEVAVVDDVISDFDRQAAWLEPAVLRSIPDLCPEAVTRLQEPGTLKTTGCKADWIFCYAVFH